MAHIRQRRAAVQHTPLMSHEERQALIRKPFFIEVIPPQKRWGGVQLFNDEEWMRDIALAARKYRRDSRTEALVDATEEY